MSTVVQKVIAWPHKAAEKFGHEVTQEFVDLINEAVAAVSATKVDKADYDAHAKLIAAQFEQARTEMKADITALKSDMRSEIRGALLKGLLWTTGLMGGLFTALYTVLK